MHLSVHDYHLYAYHVDAKQRQILLNMELPGEFPVLRDVVFNGVLDHCFRHPAVPSIILQVVEADPRDVITRDHQELCQGYRQAGWPTFWRSSTEEMIRTIADAGCRVFAIESSFGLRGWVVAESFDVIVRPDPQR